MLTGRLIIRADASAAIGHGHVMRSLALAQAWQDRGGECTFVMAHAVPELEKRLRSEECEVLRHGVLPGSREDAIGITQLAAVKGAAWVVVDGCHFRHEYYRVLNDAGIRVLQIDDYGKVGACAATAILDQNAGASEYFYRNRERSTDLLLGTRFVLLRREFTAWHRRKRATSTMARKILITMGGSDPENLTLRSIKAVSLLRNEELEVVIVVGAGNSYLDSLQAAVAARGNQYRVLTNVSSMPELMAWADIAIIAGGGTLWELLYMGCPVMTFARNSQQEEVLSYLQTRDMVHFKGLAEKCDPAGLASALSDLLSSPEHRREMAVRGRASVDGLGVERVCEVLINGSKFDNHVEYGSSLAARS